MEKLSGFGKRFTGMAEIDPKYDNDELSRYEIEILKSFKAGDSVVFKLEDGTVEDGWIYSRTAYNDKDQLTVVVMNEKDRGQQKYVRPKKFLEWQKGL